MNFLFTWTFDDLGAGKTRVTLRQGFATAADCHRIAREFGAIEGARQTLGRLSENLPRVAADSG